MLPQGDAAIANGITRWTDTNASAELLGVNGSKTKPVLDAILKSNHSESSPIVSPSCIEACRSEWHPTPVLEFFVDFETVSGQNHDFNEFPLSEGQPLIFMVGCGHMTNNEWVFKSFVSKDLTVDSELMMLQEWFAHMEQTINGLGPGLSPNIYHWAPHEATEMKEASLRHKGSSQSWPSLRLFDFLSKVVKAEPVIVKGALDFSLKTITEALANANQITSSFKNSSSQTDISIQNGEQAMIGAWSAQRRIDKGEASQLTDVPLMQSIKSYNEIDCYAMYEIVNYLRSNH